MLAGYFTKPLQGSLFWKFWKVIMGQVPFSHLDKNGTTEDDIGLTIKERVGNKIQSVIVTHQSESEMGLKTTERIVESD